MYSYFIKKNIPRARSTGATRHRGASGFTLIELLLGVTILGIVSAIAAESYVNYVKYAQFDAFAKQFLFDAREARSAATSQKEGTKWGVRVINGTFDSYEIFSTDSTYALGTSTATVFLPVGISWSSPAEGNTRDIIFSKLTGTTTADTVVAVSLAGDIATTTITANGLIY